MKLKSLFTAIFSLVLALSLCACSSGKDAAAKYTSEGMTLSVPTEYVDLLLIETADGSDRNGVLFSVHEKASVEAAKAIHPEDAGGGFLFSIGRLSEDAFLEMMCLDIPGMEVFARTEHGDYFIYYYPTDVQLVREGEYTNDDWSQWDMLCLWAAGIKDTFLSENPGLSSYQRSYTDLDIVLSRIFHWQEDFALAAHNGDPVVPTSHDSSLPFAGQLMDQVKYVSPTDDIYPSGEYITLSVPNLLWTFDFFIEEGQTHHIRQVFGQEGYINLIATLDGAPFPAGEIVARWLNTLA